MVRFEPAIDFLQPQNKSMSFRDMLQGYNSTRTMDHPTLDHEEYEDDVFDDDVSPEELVQDMNCPVILLTKEEKKRMRRPGKIPSSSKCLMAD